MSTASHPLLAAVPAHLELDDHDVVHREEGTCLVMGETGCYLSVIDGTLHIEARAALDVADAARQLCEDVNHFLLLGRCVYDEEHRVVAWSRTLPSTANTGTTWRQSQQRSCDRS